VYGFDVLCRAGFLNETNILSSAGMNSLADVNLICSGDCRCSHGAKDGYCRKANDNTQAYTFVCDYNNSTQTIVGFVLQYFAKVVT